MIKNSNKLSGRKSKLVLLIGLIFVLRLPFAMASLSDYQFKVTYVGEQDEIVTSAGFANSSFNPNLFIPYRTPGIRYSNDGIFINFSVSTNEISSILTGIQPYMRVEARPTVSFMVWNGSTVAEALLSSRNATKLLCNISGSLNPANTNAIKSLGYVIDSLGIGCSQPIPITSCPYTINAAGFYGLTQNLSSSGTCITINSDNVTVDCQGYAITGNGVGYGISNFDFNNVNVENCVIKNFNIGIYLIYTSNNLLSSNIANSNSYGIASYYSSNNDIISNTANSTSYGIEIYNSSNNNIIGNIVNSYYGIVLEQNSSNNLLSSNIANSNSLGIELVSSSNNMLTSNTVNSNSQYGIASYYSSNNSIVSNTVNSNPQQGIELVSSSNNILDSNTVNSNYLGIWLQSSSNNNIISNTVNSNSNVGIYLSYTSNNNNIISNTVNSNSNYGMFLTGISSGNLIYNNYFSNSVNAWDNGVNAWNTIKQASPNIVGGPYLGGNYWSDYNGQDTNGDGLGDTNLPYKSGGNIANGGDYLPLLLSSAPNITILSPLNNSTYDAINVTLNFTIDRPVSWIGYSVNNTANKTITDPINLTNLTNKWNNITVFANDTSGNMGSSFVKFFYCLGDVNGDKLVNMKDIATIVANFNYNCGNPLYNATYDLNSDCYINMKDVAIAVYYFNTKCV